MNTLVSTGNTATTNHIAKAKEPNKCYYHNQTMWHIKFNFLDLNKHDAVQLFNINNVHTDTYTQTNTKKAYLVNILNGACTCNQCMK